MTARQVYEGVLIEMNKVQAPSLLLEDFNYLFNKAINLYINKRYNIYDVNLLTTDDIRVLKASAVLQPIRSFTPGSKENGTASTPTYDGISGKNSSSPYGTIYDVTGMNALYGATYEAYLPMDYLHLLNCICNFKVKKTFKCYDKNTFMLFAAQRLTSDAWSTIINNFYMRPSYKRPYYYIHNVNTKRDVPTSPMRSTASVTNVIDVDGNVLTLRSGNYDNLLKLNKLSAYTFSTVTTSSSLMKVSKDNPLEIVNETLGKFNYNSTTKAYISSSNGAYYLTISGNYISTDKVTSVNKYDYVSKLAEIGVYSTGLDMDSLDKDGKATNGYTYGRYTSTHKDSDGDGYSTEPTGVSNFPRSIIIGDPNGVAGSNYAAIDAVEKPAAMRFGNASLVRLEIRYGKDDSLFELVSVYVDYIKTPQFIRLTQEQLDLTEDTSQIMEFPDYVCQEIINELVHIVMENAGDQRLQSHPVVSQSIANPAQGLAQSAGAQQG